MSTSYATLVGAGLAIWFVYQWVLFRINSAKLSAIPTVGSEGFISSYFSAWRFRFNAQRMVQEGYDKYPGRPFKVPTIATGNRWFIFLSGPKAVEDVIKATEEELSLLDVGLDVMQAPHVWGTKNATSAKQFPYQVDVVRGPMTRSFPSRFEDMKDEMVESFDDVLSVDKDWETVPIYNRLIRIMSRTTNRLFVGLPLCRNTEYLEIQESLTIHVFICATFLNLFPEFLRPSVGRLISKFRSSQKRVTELIRPLIQARIEMDALHGPKWDGRPKDLISWLLDLSAPEANSVEEIALRVIMTNFAALHTTAMTLTNAVYDLAARPEYIEPLRAEVESVINEFGWSKDSLGRMKKLDSFVKESTRLAGLGAYSLIRKVKRGITLSDGTVIPAGFRVAVAGDATHRDETIYDNASEFQGFRFVPSSEDNGKTSTRNQQLISTSPQYLLFGHGRTACPGRFLAAMEIKAIMAYLLMNYDMKLPEGQHEPPAPIWFDGDRTPSTTAELLLRKRQD